jgi:predicted nuclease of restriction endonuclease-like RecB superfamily
LTSQDEGWLSALVAELETLPGVPVGTADERLRVVVGSLARKHGVGTVQALGVWAVERRRWKSRIASAVPPEHVRELVFSAKVGRTREAALREASEALGLPSSVIEASLFADRAAARLLTPPPTAATPADLAATYNMALAQSLLLRASKVVAVLPGDVRGVVRYAKAHGLMATFESHEQGTCMRLSGPLSLFHETTKYGHSLAGLLGALAATPTWSLRARVVVRGVPLDLELDATAPISIPHPDVAVGGGAESGERSPVERRLANDLRRLRSGWRLEHDESVLHVDRRLFFPDFALVAPSGGGRVLVEVVRYWDPVYLKDKVDALARARAPIIVCIDERHATGSLTPRHDILPYRRGRIDAAALVALAEQMLVARA